MKHIILWADTPEKREIVANTGMLPQSLTPKKGILLASASERAEVEGVLFGEEIETGVVDISYIFVEEQFRRNGAGRAMVEALIGPSVYRPAGIDTLTTAYNRSDEEALPRFFDAMGFAEDPAPTSIYRFALEDFTERLKEEEAEMQEHIVSLSQIPHFRYRQFQELLERKREEAIEKAEGDVAEKRKTPFEGFIIVPDEMTAYDPELSKLLLDEEGNPCGCLLISSDGEELVIEFLCILQERVISLNEILKLSAAAFLAAKKKYPMDTAVIVNAVNPDIVWLLERITKTKPKPVHTCEFRVREMS